MTTHLQLGASLYVPATRDDLPAIAAGRKFPQLRSVIFCLEDAIREEDGATCVLGGDKAGEEDAKLGRGHFFLPTIFIDVTRNMRIAREEIFGPVLSVLKVSSLDEAIDVLNDTEY